MVLIIQTHRLVARFLYNNLDENLKSKVKYRTFVFANVKPDILRKYKRVSHYHPANEKYVFSLIEMVQDPGLSKWSFSDLLGVLVHFLCDYACVYHSNMRVNAEDSMFRHMVYEFRMHFYAVHQMRVMERAPVVKFESTDEIFVYIRDVIGRANMEAVVPDVARDFDEMMILGMSVMRFVLDGRG